MPNIFAKISLVGEAETRDVKAIFIYCKKMQTKEGSLAPSLRPGTGECLIQRQYDHGSGLRVSRSLFLYHLSFKSSWGGMVDGRNSFADHVTYLAYVSRAVINQSHNLSLALQLSTK